MAYNFATRKNLTFLHDSPCWSNPFLVCAPFFFNSVGRENEFPEVAFVDGPPSAHCAGLKDGSIHLSPASSITFAQKPGAFVLSPSLCTSCSFEVRSVKLFSRYPIEELSYKRIRMTSQSKTSVTLLRILLENRYRDDIEGIPVTRPYTIIILPELVKGLLNS